MNVFAIAMFLAAFTLSDLTSALAQPNRTVGVAPERQKARMQQQIGWEHMQREEWAAAARAFQNAIDIDSSYEYAYYSLGRAELGRRQHAAAIDALEKCAQIYRAQAGRQFSDTQEAQRYRRDRQLEIDEQLRQLRSGPQSFRTADQIRQLETMRRELDDRIERSNSVTIGTVVPAFVSLSLGSAYFRAGRFDDAEREYKATVAADPRSGEAFSNLAVVYLQAGRIQEAQQAIESAKKTGFRVNPQLEQDIRKRMKGR